MTVCLPLRVACVVCGAWCVFGVRQGWVEDVAFSPSGQQLVFVSHDSVLTVTSLAGAAPVSQVPCVCVRGYALRTVLQLAPLWCMDTFVCDAVVRVCVCAVCSLRNAAC
jgi:hypothetical protein